MYDYLEKMELSERASKWVGRCSTFVIDGVIGALIKHLLQSSMVVPSRVMRKLVCRLWLNEVSQQ